MRGTKSEGHGFNQFKLVNRTMVRMSQETLVRTDYVDWVEEFPLVIRPNADSLNLVSWATAHRDYIEAELLEHGAILFRDFNVDSISQFRQFVGTLTDELLDYRERAAPRTEVSENVYTSTEYPPDQYIPLHHEMSYSHNWPSKIWFFCAQPAREGGNTPIASDRKVFRMIPGEIKERFLRKGIMYIRNYGEGIDLPWQEVFQTKNRSAVEQYCRQSHIGFEWRDRDRLRTRAVRQVVATHPKTGDIVWFNHAHMFHSSNLEPAVRESLSAQYEDEELPRNALYGDGTRIEDSVLNQIRATYDEASVSFPWQKGDVLMLDNFLSSHGRNPFVGPRKIFVTMAELYTSSSLCGGSGVHG